MFPRSFLIYFLKMRGRKHSAKFFAIILLLTIVVVPYIFFVTLTDNTEKPTNQKEEYTHFISFCDQYQPDWKQLINVSLKTLDYFQHHQDDIVTDVAVGTRIMEAQMNILLRTKRNLSPNILRDLRTLQYKSKLVGDTILNRYKTHEDLYGAEAERVAQLWKNLQWIESARSWETPDFQQWRTLLQRNSNIEVAESVAMDTDFGEYSDGCIFGTFEYCHIPHYCIDFLWREPHSGYLLTHQILFHYMVLQNNCFSGGKRIFYESQKLVHPKKFLETMCRRVLTEAALIERLNYPDSHRDLFVEQILVCSLAGYNDFVTSDWAKLILGWSDDNGILGCYTTNPKGVSQPSVKRRVKRWDNIVQIGNLQCSVHMGALILAVIGQQLRYFLEMCYEK